MKDTKMFGLAVTAVMTMTALAAGASRSNSQFLDGHSFIS